MPLYEYQCQACGRHTEKIQKFSDPELTVCPHCGGRLERTLTAPAVQFKGGGWYKDLYSSAKPAGGSSSGGEKTASASSDGAAAKPAESSAPATSTPSAPAASSAPAAGSASKS